MRRLEAVSDTLGREVWIKLEEGCGTWGGNKVRKLEYILGRARADGVERLVGSSVGTSNWTSALAFHARLPSTTPATSSFTASSSCCSST